MIFRLCLQCARLLLTKRCGTSPFRRLIWLLTLSVKLWVPCMLRQSNSIASSSKLISWMEILKMPTSTSARHSLYSTTTGATIILCKLPFTISWPICTSLKRIWKTLTFCSRARSIAVSRFSALAISWQRRFTPTLANFKSEWATLARLLSTSSNHFTCTLTILAKKIYKLQSQPSKPQAFLTKLVTIWRHTGMQVRLCKHLQMKRTVNATVDFQELP